MRSISLWLGVMLGTVLLVAPSLFVQAAAPRTSFQVLVFSKTLGYRHTSITNGIAAIRELGARNGFAVDATGYTAMGHTESSFAEPLFQQHLLGGIRVAAGRVPADFSPNPQPVSRFAWKRESGSLALVQNENVVWQFNYGNAGSAIPPQGGPERDATLPGGDSFRPVDERAVEGGV